MTVETSQRIEPARLDEYGADIGDVLAELSSAAEGLGRSLHPATAANLAGLVRIMNTYYSNLIEGHNTRPRDIARALSGDFDEAPEKRNLQIEAAAHVRVQAKIDAMGQTGELPEPATEDFIRWLHREFYDGASEQMLTITSDLHSFVMVPGEWRLRGEHDVQVGNHIPPSSERVPTFMAYFQKRYAMKPMGKGSRILAVAAAHHRFNYIHPFADGNGRVSRLMSHAMGYYAGIDANGLWSISRGLARGLDRRAEYKQMMQHADMARQHDRDGRGNLSEKALKDFTLWFLRVCLDQVKFMSGLFEIENLAKRLKAYVVAKDLKPEIVRILEEALVRGEVERGAVDRITGLPERSARRVLNDAIEAGLLASQSPKTPVSLRFPEDSLEVVFPLLYPHT
ncbi:MAG TPA: Fic family protein [Rhizomicrobium sp.]|jgi:Fic family protein